MSISISNWKRILRSVAHETVVAVDMVVLALTLVDVTIWAEADAARKGTTKSESFISENLSKAWNLKEWVEIIRIHRFI